MEPQKTTKPSVRSEAIAVILSVSVGSGIAWLLWLATGSIVVAIGSAGPIAALSNNFLRKVI